MAETLAAFGLASNIVQFIDFGMKLVSHGRELYGSADGTSKENTDIEQIATDIKLLTQNLASGGVNHDESLQRLVKACNGLSCDLLAILETLRIDTEKNRRMEAMKKSLKSIRTRAEIKEIYKRLCKVRDQICTHLSYLLTNHLNSLIPSMRECIDTANAVGSETRAKLDLISSQLQDLMRDRPWREGESASFSTLSTSLMNLVDKAQSTRKLHAFLKSLHFKQIKEREFEVKTAHIKTFGWIFNDDNLKFSPWLRFPNDIFWIGGKAGSGKSTLMKYLCGHRLTEALLAEWAGQQKVVIASHFFWSAGTSIQKSQKGLLRSLLFQILAHAPNLIPLVCPSHWNEESHVFYPYSMRPWELADLFQAFENLARLDQLPAKFCLFIDGLDEYDGDHAEIVRIVYLLAQSRHIKLCVSSRPWTVFVDAFDRSVWKLYLQDLTRNDIRLYIKDNLEEDPRFLELKKREFIASERLVQQIVEKAQGVFLWVYLVVRSLLRGLTNSDDMSDLELRLAELPGRLEGYFKHMLNTIEDVYQQQTARTFRIMACAGSSLPLMALHFIDQERKNPNYALQQVIRPISQSDITEIVRTKIRQLNARCKDLLEVTRDGNEPFFFQHRVGFLHRTVIDFLHTNDMAILMSTRAGVGFKPDVSLCKAYLAQVKALPEECQSKPLILRNLVFTTLQHAKDSDFSRGSIEVQILDDLDRTVNTLEYNLRRGRSQVAKEPMTPSAKTEPELNQRTDSLVASPTQHTVVDLWDGIIPEGGCDCLLALAIKSGLYNYVELKVKEHGAKPGRLEEMGVLSHALQNAISFSNDSGSEFSWKYEIDLSMLRLLLDLGASPESFSRKTGQTFWMEYLQHCITDRSKQRTVAWDMTKFLNSADSTSKAPEPLSNTLETCELLLEHGAGRNSYPGSPEGIEIITECFTDEEVGRLLNRYEKLHEERVNVAEVMVLLRLLWMSQGQERILRTSNEFTVR